MTNVHHIPSSSPRLASAWTETCAHCPGPPTPVLGKVTLALVLAIPVMLVLLVLFGVLAMRAGPSSPQTGDSMSTGALRLNGGREML